MLDTLKPLTGPVFPYGTFCVDAEVCERYAQDYARARSYPLPARLPSHHPLLQRLEGTYPLAYEIPPWWHACVSQMKSKALRQVLATISPAEFRTGCLEQLRWKAFRATLSADERRQVPTSPKIATLLEQTEWEVPFGTRGPVDAPEQLKLVISTRPHEFLYMSNGWEWRSCQHFDDGSENQCLPGNFYDTGVAVAMLLPAHMQVEEPSSVLARTTLRVFRANEQTVVAIGRTYHNNATLALLLVSRLATLLDEQYLTWGFMSEVNTLSDCRHGLLGPALLQRLHWGAWGESEACWFPDSWHLPYIDGGEHDWQSHWEKQTDEYFCMHLSATIMLMHPRPHLSLSTHTRRAITGLASVGMLPLAQ